MKKAIKKAQKIPLTLKKRKPAQGARAVAPTVPPMKKGGMLKKCCGGGKM